MEYLLWWKNYLIIKFFNKVKKDIQALMVAPGKISKVLIFVGVKIEPAKDLNVMTAVIIYLSFYASVITILCYLSINICGIK